MVIPVLGIPYLTRSDLMLRAVTSINHPVDELVIVDNSVDDTCPIVDGARHIKTGSNMGVSWAWNTIIMATREAPYWVIANADIRFGPEDLVRMEERMQAGVDLLLNESMALFAISGNCIQTVGWFDTMFVPAYCEDNDYIYRSRLMGIDVQFLEPQFEHFGSASIKSSDGFRKANSVSYPMNVKYYREKWGGSMGHEVYTSPFDNGGSPRDTPPLDLDRLRALSWD